MDINNNCCSYCFGISVTHFWNNYIENMDDNPVSNKY